MDSDLHLPPELAAGGVVWRLENDKVQLLLIHRPYYGDWGLPKGKLDEGESLLHCALREVEEETGYSCWLGKKLPQVRYLRTNGKPKLVAFWAMQKSSGSFTPNKEVDRVKWLPFSKAVEKLTYEPDRKMLESLDAKWTERPRRVLLVRHGHAGDRHRWDGKDDSKRPLSAKGERQAKELINILRPFSIDRVITSPATRCKDTVVPVAAERGRRITKAAELWEDAPLDESLELVHSARRGVTVLSSHGPVIGAILRSVLKTRRPIPYEKGSVWVLDIRKRAVRDASYLPPMS